MKNPRHNDPIDILGAAYEKMYERVATGLANARDKSADILHRIIDEARNRAIELEELTEEDATRVAQWIKRDMTDAIEYIAEGDNELKDWLGFETRLLETAFLELMLETADKTTVELLALKENARCASVFNTGEITSPGSLVCDQCEEILHFHKVGKIPPCPKCHATTFHRMLS